MLSDRIVISMKKIPRVVLLFEKSREFGRGLLRGVVDYSRIRGPWTFLMYPPYYLESQDSKKIFAWLKKSNPDGIILRSLGGISIRAMEELNAQVIVHDVDEEVPGVPNIVTEELAIGRMAAEHLLERGFSHFAFCGVDQMWSRQRCKSFCATVGEAGFDTHVYEQPKRKADRSFEKERYFITKWIRFLPKPIGLMACNDDRGQYLLELCKAEGIVVPNQMAVIGADNDELICDMSDPPLTSIALNTKKAGYAAAELLDRMMTGHKPDIDRVLVPPTHIVTRQSTNVLAIRDEAVARAVAFILTHANNPIQVSDVAEAAAVSRRTLQKQFRQLLRTSVHRYISRARVERISTMLLESDTPTYRIAQVLGYPNAGSLSRAFHKEKGISPIAFRKRYRSH
jgi:LacI family transcriptional regulator